MWLSIIACPEVTSYFDSTCIFSCIFSIFSDYQFSKREHMLYPLLKDLYTDWLINRQKKMDNIQYCVADVSFVIQNWGMGAN